MRWRLLRRRQRRRYTAPPLRICACAPAACSGALSGWVGGCERAGRAAFPAVPAELLIASDASAAVDGKRQYDVHRQPWHPALGG